MRAAALFLALAGGVLPVLPLCAQSQPAAETVDPSVTAATPILVFDQQRLFSESQFGLAALARRKANEDALIAENLRIEQGLEAEERDLTTRRATLPADEFRALADAFDTKVEGVRAAQRAKYDAITGEFENDQRAFFGAAVPVIRTLMREAGAVVVVDKNAIFMSLERIDVTDTAIQRLDATIGNGTVGNGTGVPGQGDPALVTPPVQP
ncbi:MAG: OmpH family outer membrane protein [Paracoccaceae bacterium]